MSQTFANSIRIKLDKVSKAEFISVAILSVLVACMAGAWAVYRVGYFDGQVRCGYPCIGSGHKSIFVDAMRLRIAIALGATAIGMCAKRSSGFFVSLVSLAFSEIQYIYWYIWSIRWLYEAGLEDFSRLPSQTEIPHALGLYGGTSWDILVFGIASVLLLWQLRLVFGAFKLRAGIQERDSRQT